MDIFKEIIKELSPLLKRRGFIKKGNTFYLEAGKNYGVINFQKSRDSTKDLMKLTINFGIYSDIFGDIQRKTECKYGYGTPKSNRI